MPSPTLKTCQHPECGKGVRSDNVTGFCRRHLPSARTTTAPRREIPADRRVALVPRTGTSTDAEDRWHRVTLPREPWIGAAQ